MPKRQLTCVVEQVFDDKGQCRSQAVTRVVTETWDTESGLKPANCKGFDGSLEMLKPEFGFTSGDLCWSRRHQCVVKVLRMHNIMMKPRIEVVVEVPREDKPTAAGGLQSEAFVDADDLEPMNKEKYDRHSEA